MLNSCGDVQQATGDTLLPEVYQQLRQLAAWRLSHEPPGHSLAPTALVHEAYLRLIDQSEQQQWDSRRHFFSAAAEAMRRVLVESARRKQSLKRGGNLARRDIDDGLIAVPCPADELLDLNEALDRLSDLDSKAAELVKLRYFSGLSQKEAADVLELPRRSADRLWAFAKAWLFRELQDRN